MFPPNSQPFQEVKNTQFLLPLDNRRAGNKKKEKTNSAVSTRRSSSDSLDLNLKFKTEMCKYFIMGNECPFGCLCCFAHGEYELRARDAVPVKYKTRPCVKFTQEGFCPYGKRCQFIHPSPSHIINHPQLLNQLTTDPTLFFQMVDLKALTCQDKPSFLQKLSKKWFQESTEASQEDDPSLNYQTNFYHSSSQMEGHRSRYNSF